MLGCSCGVFPRHGSIVRNPIFRSMRPQFKSARYLESQRRSREHNWARANPIVSPLPPALSLFLRENWSPIIEHPSSIHRPGGTREPLLGRCWDSPHCNKFNSFLRVCSISSSTETLRIFQLVCLSSSQKTWKRVRLYSYVMIRHTVDTEKADVWLHKSKTTKSSKLSLLWNSTNLV